MIPDQWRTTFLEVAATARRYRLPTKGRIGLFLLAFPLLAACLTGCTPPNVAQGFGWLRGYLIGKVADGIWDEAFGKPDTVELDRRLRGLEEEIARIQASFASPIRGLRTKIKHDTTRNDYFAMATEAGDQIEELEHRIQNLESQLSRQSLELERQRNLANARVTNNAMTLEPTVHRTAPSSASSAKKLSGRRQGKDFAGTLVAMPQSPLPRVEILLRTWDWNGGDHFSAPDDHGLTMRWRLESGSPIEPLPSGEYPTALQGAFMRERGRITFHTGNSVFIY